MTQDIIPASQLSSIYKSHTHPIENENNLIDKLKSKFRLDKPDLTKLSSRAFGRSGESSAASSVKSGKNKELERKYGTVKALIGEGGSSVVWMTRLKESNEIFAVKSYKADSKDKKIEFHENVIAEFKILSSLEHQNVVRTFDLLAGGFIWFPNPLLIFFPNGNL